MSTCLICGTSVDGRVCGSHQEDVAFEFRGNRADQLVEQRYYQGSVDGFADFGVFVDVGDSVTGLLHTSEIEGRLESLDWKPGDTVYVQVLEVHNNGNVDLGWSIRQSDREFRGTLVHDPGADPTEFEPESESESAPDTEAAEPDQPDRSEQEATTETDADDEADADTPETEAATAESEPTDDEPDPNTSETEADDQPVPGRVEAAALDEHVDDRVRVEGQVSSVQQTGGPTVFEVVDETGNVDCAAFVAAGERAYPEVEADEVVSLVGAVEYHRGEIQVETESIDVLAGDDRAAVLARLDSALTERARPPERDLLTDDPAVDAVEEPVYEAATAVRRAVVEGRPVVIRHAASVDGYVGGAAIERAAIHRVREANPSDDAEYRYVERRPLPDPFYDMSAATDDVTSLLTDEARHGEQPPLVVFVDVGATRESADGFEFLGAYDADRVVVDDADPEPAVETAADVVVGTPERSATTLATTVAAYVAPDLREDLTHLPAVTYWEDTPEAYAALAADAGYAEETLRDLREATALEAYYQSYEGKRELVEDLFWEESHDLAAYVGTQFREKLDEELATAEPHVDRRTVDGVTVDVLDTDAFTHRFDFPSADVLLDALHRHREGEPRVTVGVGEDDLRVRATADLDLRALGESVAAARPDAGVRPRGDHEGFIEFLQGERDAVVDATVEAVADRLTDTEATAAAED
jgi:RecJ-like exonuclease